MRAVPSAQCLSLIRSFEKGPESSWAAKPYNDPAGIPTYGWGHRIQPGDPPEIQNQGQADALALGDLTTAAAGVCDAISHYALLTDGQYAALIDFAYNVGVATFRGSTLCLYVNHASFNLVPAQFGLWVHARVNGVETVMDGLIRRRKAEVAVWLS